MLQFITLAQFRSKIVAAIIYVAIASRGRYTFVSPVHANTSTTAYTRTPPSVHAVSNWLPRVTAL